MKKAVLKPQDQPGRSGREGRRMPFGFVILGMILGLCAAGAALVCGLGIRTAFLIYAGAGSGGFGLAVLVVLLGQGLRVAAAASGAPARLL